MLLSGFNFVLSDRIFVVSEHFTLGFGDVRSALLTDLRWIRQLTYETLNALAFLHAHGVVHRNLTLAALRITPQAINLLHSHDCCILSESVCDG